MKNFIFNRHLPARVAFEARVPAGITTKEALMDALQSALRFPEYFGGNWDALEECVRDLSWLPEGDVVLLNEDLPLSNNRADLVTYLSILFDAIDKWDSAKERQLLVVFPPGTEETVRGLLERSRAWPGAPGPRS
jgi:RNAse (barnase) inhibitor barstar